MADRLPCPRCGWPTKFGVEIKRTDGVARYVCLPCVWELGSALMSRRDNAIDIDRERLEGQEDER